MGHDPAHRPGPAQLGGGALGVAVLQQAADARRADRPLRVGQRRHHREADAQRLRALREKGDIAAAPVPEGEIRAAGQVRRAHAPVQHLLHERIGAQQGKGAVERHLVHDLHAERRQRRGALRREREAEGRVVRAEQLARVRLEGQDGEHSAGPRGMDGAEHVGVAEVDPVEVAQRDRGAAQRLRQAAPVADNLDGSGLHQARLRGAAAAPSLQLSAISLSSNAMRPMQGSLS